MQRSPGMGESCRAVSTNNKPYHVREGVFYWLEVGVDENPWCGFDTKSSGMILNNQRLARRANHMDVICNVIRNEFGHPKIGPKAEAQG